MIYTMLTITHENSTRIAIHDGGALGRVVALMFCLAGVLLVYFFYPDLPDGNGVIGGVIIGLLGLVVFFTKRSYTLVFDKRSKTVSRISTTLLGKKKTTTIPFSDIQEVNLQWVVEMHAGAAWLLYLVVKHEEEMLSINENHAPMTRFFPPFQRSKNIGKEIAAFLNIPFQQKKFFEN